MRKNGEIFTVLGEKISFLKKGGGAKISFFFLVNIHSCFAHNFLFTYKMSKIDLNFESLTRNFE